MADLVPELPLTSLLSPWMLGFVGLCVGSFLNVVIHRLPLMLERGWWSDVAHQLADTDSWRRVFGARHAAPPPAMQSTAELLAMSVQALPELNIARPRSRCPLCARPVAWHENIPLLGWLRLKGQCAGCGGRISIRYPAIELMTGALFAGLGWKFGAQPAVALWCAVVATLIVLAAIDWDTTVLPDILTLPLLWGGLIAAAIGWTLPLSAAVAGAAAGYLALWSVYWLFKFATGKEGMGYGDFKLLAALGAWMGWQVIVPILLMASILGALVGIAMKFNQQLREGRYVPFGPFLAGAGVVVILADTPTVLGWIGWA